MNSWIQGSALDQFRTTSDLARVTGQGLNIREVPLGSMLLLQARGDPSGISKAFETVIGSPLPLRTNTLVNGNVTALWLGTRKWLLLTNAHRSRELMSQLEVAGTEFPCLISDVSDARCGIAVGGHEARNLLAKVCALDLHAETFKTGQCAQSQLARIPVLLYQKNALPTYHLFVDRSLASYAWDWLADAATEFCEPAPL